MLETVEGEHAESWLRLKSPIVSVSNLFLDFLAYIALELPMASQATSLSAFMPKLWLATAVTQDKIENIDYTNTFYFYRITVNT
jgi:hypothetical protein